NAADKTAKLWKAKYYLALFERCRRSTSDGSGLDARRLINNGAWEHGDGSTLKNDNYKLRTDPLLGSGVSYCPDTTFNGQGVFGALVDALADIQPTYGGTPGGAYGNTTRKKRWTEMNIREKGHLLCSLGLAIFSEGGSSIFDKEIQKGSIDGCAEVMERFVNGGETVLYLMDDKLERGLYISSEEEGKRVTERLLAYYSLTSTLKIDTNSTKTYYTDAEMYYNEYYSYTKRCAKYDKTIYSSYPSRMANVSDQRIKVIEFPEVTSNGIVKRYIVNDAVANNDTVENSLYYGNNTSGNINPNSLLPEKSLSCLADAGENEWRHAYANLKAQVRDSGIYTTCAADYRKVYDTIKTDGPKKLDEARNQAVAKLKSSAEKLVYGTTHPSNYDLCISGSNGAPGNVYDCTGEVQINQYKEEKDYDNKLKAAAVRMGSTNGILGYDSGEWNCWGPATTDYDKYNCNLKRIQDQTCTAANVTNFEEVYNAVQEFSVIDRPLAILKQINYNIEKINENTEEAKETLKISALVSPDIVSNSAINLVMPTSSNPYDSQGPAVAMILKGIYNLHYEETSIENKRETEISCNISEYTDKYLKVLEDHNIDVPELKDTVLLAGSGTFQDDYKGSGAYGGGGANAAVSTCEGSALLGWVLCPVIKFTAGGADLIYKMAVEQNLRVEAGYLAADDQGAHQAWQFFVGFANIILVILFLLVIFSQLTGYGIDNYGIKRVLPKLIVVAILINLSFIICQIAVDVSNILGHNLESMLDGIGISMNEEAKKNIAGELIGNMLTGVGLVGAVVGGVYVIKNISSLVTGLLIPALLALLVALIAIIFFFVLLGVRKAGIIVLAVVSPVAIICYALPNTKKFFDKWFKGFKSLLMVYPICGLMLSMSRFVAKLISANNYGFIGNLVALAVLVYPFFVIPTLVSKAISAVTSLGDKITQAGRGLRRKTRDGVKNTAAYQEAQKRREAAREQRRQQNFRRFQEGEGISGRLFGGKMKKYNDEQRRLNADIADAQKEREEALKNGDTAAADAASLKEAAARAKKAKSTEKWLGRKGTTIEDEYAKIATEDAKIQARIEYDRDVNPQTTEDENGNKRFVSTTESLSEAARIQAANAALSQLARANQPPREIDVEIATNRATSAHQTEEQKAYSEQFGTLDKTGLVAAFENSLRRFSEGRGDINEVQAAVDMLQKGGYTKELLNVFSNIDKLNPGTWDAISRDGAAMNAIVGMLGKSGNIVMKGYSKYLTAARAVDGAKQVDFETWLNKGDAQTAELLNNLQQGEGESDADFATRRAELAKKVQKVESLKNLGEFNKTTFGGANGTHDILLSANKDTMEVLKDRVTAGKLGTAIDRN
ncbi:hypothetical protein J6T21_01480, partial [Candidatus Saccharibacteria bacterium]|nr:hypothetical protein [Candidatus Saccharibacteria bacterium]